MFWLWSALVHDVFMTQMHFPQMEAERRLLIAALRDAANQRFVLLSETCVPLFPPAAVWLQLMHESRSRLNACARNTTADINRRMIFRRVCTCGSASVAVIWQQRSCSHSTSHAGNYGQRPPARAGSHTRGWNGHI